MTPARDPAHPPSAWTRLQPALYALWAGACTLAVATWFYSSLHLQTHYSALEAQPDAFARAAAGERLGEWSAPLDDVFIHFDFARATARGHPFEWSEGNGYSSGGTSLLYPFVLAFGYWLGFRKMQIAVWAAIVACVSVFALLLAGRRLFASLPSWTAFVLPPTFLSVGALSWSLWSGMEVALHLALWAAAFLSWDSLVRGPDVEARVGWRAASLGLWLALTVATRPESVVVVAVFALSAAWVTAGRRGRRAAFAVLVAASVPAALVIVAHSCANLLLTGDLSAAGAVAKLELHHPHLTARAVWDAWKFHVGYQVMRVTHYHLSEVPGFGWLLWALAAVPLLRRATRGPALLLWCSAALWILVVALNGQVRWQNERYTMPAVAWLVLSSALGLGVALGTAPARGRRGVVLGLAGSALAVSAFALYAWQQVPRYREQVWFFGRAARNIRDQHVLTGRLLRHLRPTPKRVLVGDAGAIPYAADLPALDIIGLGGYRGLPFARATRWGVPAAIELLERMPRTERPDVLALYPSWWGTFPLWFGEPIAEVPVRGNVICGGPSKVVYRADWTALEDSESPTATHPGKIVMDAVDFADIVSEREHDYGLSRKAVGFLTMKRLPHPARPDRDLWDAGRIVPPDTIVTFDLRRLTEGRELTLVFRTAPIEKARVRIVIDGAEVGHLDLVPSDAWREPAVVVPGTRVKPSIRVRLEAVSGEHVLHHLWALQPQ